MITASKLDNGVCYLTSIGSADTQQLLQLLDEYVGTVVLNCAADFFGVRYISNMNVIIFLYILIKFNSYEDEKVLINPVGHPQKMLFLTKLTSILARVADKADTHQKFIPAAF